MDSERTYVKQLVQKYMRSENDSTLYENVVEEVKEKKVRKTKNIKRTQKLCGVLKPACTSTPSRELPQASVATTGPKSSAAPQPKANTC